MPGTPRLGLPYPAESASPDVPRDLLALATPLDGAVLFSSGPLANRPVSTALNPGVAGREYRATDDLTAGSGGTTWKDTGAGWETTVSGTDPRLPAGTVTVLPASPVDGQEINFLADPTNGVEWRLRYRAASASAYKWEFLGGPPLYNEVLAYEGAPSSTYGSLGTPGPTITLPVPNGGDFDVTFGAVLSAGSVNVQAFMGIATSSSPASDTFAATSNLPAYSVGSLAGAIHGLGLTGAVVANYRTNGGNAASYLHRYMRVTPVRVG